MCNYVLEIVLLPYLAHDDLGHLLGLDIGLLQGAGDHFGAKLVA